VGQAKNRGTFEERKARAISNKMLDNAILTHNPRICRKKSVSNALMLAAAFGSAAASKENKWGAK
jgi:hypothetical protein